MTVDALSETLDQGLRGCRPRDDTSLDAAIDSLIERVAERNSDFYELLDGRLTPR